MRIGIFGGTFDPPHLGHCKYAEEFIDRLRLDKLLVIPTFIPPHKEHDGASCEDRLNMTRLAFDDMSSVLVSDMEIKRGGRSYTCDTVRELSELYSGDELIFMIGSDMLLTFGEWKNPKEILKYVKICAVCRDLKSETITLTHYIVENFSEEKDRFIICDFTPFEISSTDIRDAVKNGENIGDMVDERVADYIDEKELYR